MSAATASSPIPIAPKPAFGKAASSSGPNATPPIVKRPRGGPVVFVNASDLNAEGENANNRRTVKRWAMLNRHNSHVNSSANKSKAQFLSWDSSTPQRDSKGLGSAGHAAKQAAMRSRHQSVDLIGGAALSHPNRSLPAPADASVKKMLEFYRSVGSPIATFESDPSFPIKSNKKGVRDYYLGGALSETYALITGKDRKPSGDAFLSVSLLIWVAFLMGDSRAVNIHFTGMAGLVVDHWDIFISRPFFRGGAFYWENRRNEGDLLPGGGEPALPSPEADTWLDVLHSKEFDTLQAFDVIPNGLLYVVELWLRMNPLLQAGHARSLNVPMAQDLLRYTLLIARELATLEDSCQTPSQHCLRYIVIIQFYSSVWRNSRTGVGWLAATIREQLESTSGPVDFFLGDWPLLLLWLVLTAGPFSSGPLREWYSKLLAQALSKTSSGFGDFDFVILELETHFIWTRELDGKAREFWEETPLYDVAP